MIQIGSQEQKYIERSTYRKQISIQIRYPKYTLPQNKIQMEHHVPAARSQTPKRSHKSIPIVTLKTHQRKFCFFFWNRGW